MNKIRFSIDFDEEMYEELRRISYEQNRPIADIIREAITKLLKKQK